MDSDFAKCKYVRIFHERLLKQTSSISFGNPMIHFLSAESNIFPAPGSTTVGYIIGPLSP